MVKKPANRPFHLKQFSLHHHRSTMKVGTDSLLLGVWIRPEGCRHILDIGTGCGILALLMAARTDAEVDAVEFDDASYEEADENFRNSLFNERLTAINTDFRTYAGNSSKSYDLIVANPPFFINDMRPKEKKRSHARHGDQLNYNELCTGVVNLLNPDGRFCLVLPYTESRTFIHIAEKYGLYISRQLLIFPKRGWQPNRINLELSLREKINPVTEKFTIREENGRFSQQYTDFFKNYLTAPD